MDINDAWIENDFVKPSDDRKLLVAYTDKDGNKTTTVGSYTPEDGWVDDKGRTVPNVEWWRDLPNHPSFYR